MLGIVPCRAFPTIAGPVELAFYPFYRICYLFELPFELLRAGRAVIQHSCVCLYRGSVPVVSWQCRAAALPEELDSSQYDFQNGFVDVCGPLRRCW